MELLFLSRMLGRAIQDKHGEKIASLKDVIVRINPEEGKSEENYPPLAGLVARATGRDFFIPYSQVEQFDEKGIKLYSARVSLERFIRRNGEILLARDVLDRQLVDVEGRRVIRVNDLALTRIPNDSYFRLVGVDISFQAIIRRIGPYNRISPQRQIGRKDDLIDWADVEYFASEAPAVRLSVSHDRLAKLHPVDIARLMDELSYVQGTEIVNALDDETAADTLEEMEPEDAADILEGLDENRAADILEEMEPDNAADLIAEIEDKEKADSLLNLMESEEQEDVRELLSYEEDSAGGIMTTEFVALPDNLTLMEGVRALRAMPEKPPMLYYIYVVEPGTEKLVGATSLRDMVLEEPRNRPISEIMERDFVSVYTDTPARDAAEMMTEYNLMALPVLDPEGNLRGIITADDAMELAFPQVSRQIRRFPFPTRHGGKRALSVMSDE